jgi:hypothetical protein
LLRRSRRRCAERWVRCPSRGCAGRWRCPSSSSSGAIAAASGVKPVRSAASGAIAAASGVRIGSSSQIQPRFAPLGAAWPLMRHSAMSTALAADPLRDPYVCESDRMSDATRVSEIFDPSAWQSVPGFEGLTDRDLSPSARARHRADCVRPPGGTQRLPAPHGGRTAPRARPRAYVRGRGLRSAHRQRTLPPRRWLGLLLRRRPAHPGTPRLRVRRRGDGRHGGQGAPRSAAHPGVPAPDPVHAQGGHQRGAGWAAGAVTRCTWCRT